MQGADLVVHQRNQGRHHEGDTLARAVPRNRRNLVTQAFATAGGHQNQRVMARHHVFDNGLLGPAEMVVTENFAKNLLVGQGDMGMRLGCACYAKRRRGVQK
jgi:hypothetical protein